MVLYLFELKVFDRILTKGLIIREWKIIIQIYNKNNRQFYNVYTTKKVLKICNHI